MINLNVKIGVLWLRSVKCNLPRPQIAYKRCYGPLLDCPTLTNATYLIPKVLRTLYLIDYFQSLQHTLATSIIISI